MSLPLDISGGEALQAAQFLVDVVQFRAQVVGLLCVSVSFQLSQDLILQTLILVPGGVQITMNTLTIQTRHTLKTSSYESREDVAKTKRYFITVPNLPLLIDQYNRPTVFHSVSDSIILIFHYRNIFRQKVNPAWKMILF